MPVITASLPDLRLVVLLAALVLLGAGCAAPPDRAGREEGLAGIDTGVRATENRYWWYARFKITWPEGEAVNSAVSLLLAREVIAPVLDKHARALPRWRFHRRAIRDPGGHRFSFIFYSDPATAERIFKTLRANPVLKQALSANLIESLKFDDPERPSRPDPGDTSDPRWPATLQAHWPAYIMGASALWLGLIEDQIEAGPPPAGADIETRLAAYRRAEQAIDAIWYRDGQHALFHHLNAIFGYEPMLIRKEMRF